MRSIFLFLVFSVSTLCAQQSRVEFQVPMDTSGTVNEISPELRDKARLFPEMENFLSAKLFQQDDSTFILEISFRTKGVLARKRIVQDAVAIQTFRQELSQQLAKANQSTGMDQEGRAGLIVRQTIMGLSFYAWAVPAILDIEGGREIVATYMLVGAAGFAVPYYITQDIPVSNTQTMLTFYGSTRGLLYGLFLKNMISPNAHSTSSDLAPPLLASLASSCIAFQLAGGKDWDLGRAELVGVMGDFGTGLGAGVAHVSGMWDTEAKKASAHATLLGTSGLGLAYGYYLSQRESYTRGDAYVLRMNGLLGSQLLMPLVAAIGDKKDKAYTTGAMLGAALGIGIGNRLLRSQNFTFSEGTLISCGHIAGGLLAGGITYLLDVHDKFDELVYLSTTALGSLAGQVLLYRTFARQRTQEAKVLDGLHLSFSPTSLILNTSRSQSERSGGKAPFLTAQWLF